MLGLLTAIGTAKVVAIVGRTRRQPPPSDDMSSPRLIATLDVRPPGALTPGCAVT